MTADDRAKVAPIMRELDMLSGTLLELAERAALADDGLSATRVLELATRIRVESRLVARYLWPELDGRAP